MNLAAIVSINNYSQWCRRSFSCEISNNYCCEKFKCVWLL